MNEVLKRLENTILGEDNSLVYSIFEGRTELVKKHFQKSLEVFTLLEKNEEPRVGKYFIRDTFLLVDIVKSFLIFSPISESQNKFLHDYLEFMVNINNAVIHDKQLQNDILLAIRLVDFQISTVELIEVLREWRLYLNKVLNVRPPAYKLAEHYLKVLREEIENDK